LIIDVMDSYMKGGWSYIIEQGVFGWGYDVAGIPLAVIGFRSTRIRTHTIMGIVYFVWQAVLGFNLSPLLHR
jgi:urea transporter